MRLDPEIPETHRQSLPLLCVGQGLVARLASQQADIIPRSVGREVGKGFVRHLEPEEEVEGQGTYWALMDILVTDGHSQLSSAFLVCLAF